MTPFSFAGRATIKHLNPRKEGPDDAKELALDVKLQGKAPAELFDSFHEGLRPVLYTDAGAAKNILMEAIGFTYEIGNCTVEILGRTFLGVSVGKFKLKPCDGWRVDLTLSITIQPSADEVAEFAEYLQDEVDVSITPAPDLFAGGQGEVIVAQFGTPSQTPVDDVDLMRRARLVIADTGRASISALQRHLSIGYNRAAHILEALESVGVVSAAAPDGSRQVLIV